MRRSSAVAAAFAALVTMSCGSVAPVKIAAGEVCYRCRRVIVDARVAAEMMNGGLASKFRGPGCLAKYLADHPTETGRLFVTDYDTGKLVPPSSVEFVSVIVNERTFERDYRAFLDPQSASRAAAALNTQPVSWETVLAHARS